MYLDEKIVLQQWTTDSYWISCLNPDWSLIGGWVWNVLYTQLIDYVSWTNPVYVWEAPTWSLWSESGSIWRIKKLTYDINDNITALTWADWDTNFNNIWDNRATITYS